MLNDQDFGYYTYGDINLLQEYDHPVVSEHAMNHNWVSPSEECGPSTSPLIEEQTAGAFMENLDLANEMFSSLSSEIGDELESASTSLFIPEVTESASESQPFIKSEEKNTENELKSTGPQLVWVEPTVSTKGDFSPAVQNSSDGSDSKEIAAVRKRIEKRKSRATRKSEDDKVAKLKQNRNTLAARRYRQKRQEEVEVLDKRVKELEKQLSDATLQAKWWEMEAQRWKSMVEEK